ncbi:LysE family translocator [Streptomyces sp. B6B3]|uniref:LysE family translocator n=1 Tax=Streptomyces sp. B6B3 TaxID=3153570 RepID=UPI00325EEDB2
MDTRSAAAFLIIDLLLVCTPGADWAYAISAGLRERSVVPAVGGMVAAYAAHTVLALTGLTLLVAGSAGLLTALTVAGAGYLVWLGGTVLTRPAGPVSPEAPGVAASPWRTAAKGFGISGLNPKGLLLYFSLFPQFVSTDAGAWPVAAQTALLGGLHMTNCATVYLAVGVLARRTLAARPAAARAVTRVSGAAMVGIGALLLAEHLTPWDA